MSLARLNIIRPYKDLPPIATLPSIYIIYIYLPVKTAIYEENSQTTIDLIFATPAITAGIVTCGIKRDLDYSSDHLPILTRLMLNIIDSP